MCVSVGIQDVVLRREKVEKKEAPSRCNSEGTDRVSVSLPVRGSCRDAAIVAG